MAASAKRMRRGALAIFADNDGIAINHLEQLNQIATFEFGLALLLRGLLCIDAGHKKSAGAEQT